MHKHILLIEDDPAIADPLTYALSREQWRVTWCATGAQALAALDNGIDCILLDIGLPDTDGLTLCRHIRAHSNIPILFLTARNDEIDRIVGLELGADDYIGKPFSSRELISRIKAVCRRSAAPPLTAAPELWTHDSAAQTIAYHGHALTLTRYEYRLLAHFLAHPGQPFNRDQLVNTLWDHPEHIDNRTVDSHIKTLRQKLHAIAADEDPIRTRRGYGYQFFPYPEQKP